MKYLKTFEEVGKTERNSRSVRDREFISSMEDSIEGIFIDMIDDGFNLEMALTDYVGNCGHFRIGKPRNDTWSNSDKKITEYLDIFHMFFDYINEKGYRIKDINLGGWISDEDDRTISFRHRDWEFIEKQLIKAAKDRPFYGLSLYLDPIETKWVTNPISGRGDYVPLYKLKNVNPGGVPLYKLKDPI